MKGKWFIDGDYITTNLDIIGNVICEAPDKSMRDSYVKWPTNAKLIQQAPELLEVLQELLAFCKSHNIDNFYTGQAEAVIDNILKP